MGDVLQGDYTNVAGYGSQVGRKGQATAGVTGGTYYSGGILRNQPNLYITGSSAKEAKANLEAANPVFDPTTGKYEVTSSASYGYQYGFARFNETTGKYEPVAPPAPRELQASYYARNPNATIYAYQQGSPRAAVQMATPGREIKVGGKKPPASEYLYQPGKQTRTDIKPNISSNQPQLLMGTYKTGIVEPPKPEAVKMFESLTSPGDKQLWETGLGLGAMGAMGFGKGVEEGVTGTGKMILGTAQDPLSIPKGLYGGGESLVLFWGSKEDPLTKISKVPEIVGQFKGAALGFKGVKVFKENVANIKYVNEPGLGYKGLSLTLGSEMIPSIGKPIIIETVAKTQSTAFVKALTSYSETPIELSSGKSFPPIRIHQSTFPLVGMVTREGVPWYKSFTAGTPKLEPTVIKTAIKNWVGKTEASPLTRTGELIVMKSVDYNSFETQGAKAGLASARGVQYSSLPLSRLGTFIPERFTPKEWAAARKVIEQEPAEGRAVTIGGSLAQKMHLGEVMKREPHDIDINVVNPLEFGTRALEALKATGEGEYKLTPEGGVTKLIEGKPEHLFDVHPLNEPSSGYGLPSSKSNEYAYGLKSQKPTIQEGIGFQKIGEQAGRKTESLITPKPEGFEIKYAGRIKDVPDVALIHGVLIERGETPFGIGKLTKESTSKSYGEFLNYLRLKYQFRKTGAPGALEEGFAGFNAPRKGFTEINAPRLGGKEVLAFDTGIKTNEASGFETQKVAPAYSTVKEIPAPSSAKTYYFGSDKVSSGMNGIYYKLGGYPSVGRIPSGSRYASYSPTLNYQTSGYSRVVSSVKPSLSSSPSISVISGRGYSPFPSGYGKYDGSGSGSYGSSGSGGYGGGSSSGKYGGSGYGGGKYGGGYGGGGGSPKGIITPPPTVPKVFSSTAFETKTIGAKSKRGFYLIGRKGGKEIKLTGSLVKEEAYGVAQKFLQAGAQRTVRIRPGGVAEERGYSRAFNRAMYYVPKTIKPMAAGEVVLTQRPKFSIGTRAEKSELALARKRR